MMAMQHTITGYYLAVLVNNHRICLPLSSVHQVTAAAALQPAPSPMHGLMGMLNLSGQLIPVLSAHVLLGLPMPELEPAHRFVIIQAHQNPAAQSERALVFALHVNEIIRLLNDQDCSHQQVLIPQDNTRHAFRLMSCGDEKFWLFEANDLLNGIDINRLASLT